MARCARRGAAAREFLVGLALFVLCAGFAIWRQWLHIRDMRPYRPYLSANLIPEARTADLLRPLALGWDEAAAVFLWLRTIQDFGGQFRDPFALQSMANAFWSMAALAPLFTEMYDFGGLVIGDEGGSADLWLTRVNAPEAWRGVASSAEAIAHARSMREQAMRLFEAGIIHDRDHYIHPYNAVYTAMSGMRDPRRAIPYAEVAVTRPDCPEWVEGTIPYLLGRSGQYRVALSQWLAQLRAAIQNQDQLGLSIRMRKIAEDGVNPWNCQILTDAMRLWSELHGGALPDNLDRLLAEGYLSVYPEDLAQSIDAWRQAHGGHNPPDVPTLAAGGFLPLNPAEPPEPLRFFDYGRFLADTVRLVENATPFATIPEEELGLERYLTVAGRLPECPLNLWAEHTGDQAMLRRRQEMGGFRYVIDRLDRVVRDSSRLYEETARDLVAIRLRLDRWNRDHGGAWPASIAELFAVDNLPEPTERGTGQPYLYDPEEGIARSAFFAGLASLVFRPFELPGAEVVGGPRPLDEQP